MTDVASLRPVAAVLVSLIALGVIVLGRRRPLVRDWTPVAAALVKFGIVASLVPATLAGETHVTELGTFAPGIEFTLRADPLGTLFAVVASGLWLATSVYSVGYIRGAKAENRARYNAGLCLSMSAAMGVAFGANLLVLLVFYELTTVGTYPLVAHKETDRARRVGYEYVAYVLTGGTAVFAGAVVTFALAGTVTFVPGGIPELADAAATSPLAATAGAALLLVGFAVKGAVIPLHAWLPRAMVAPTPVSGVLHAVVVVKSGVFGIARTVLETYGPATIAALGLSTPLAAAAGATIVLGSLLALRQDDIKRRLAYSTVAQLSYVVLGIALLVPIAVAGGLFHIAAHAVAKLTLFFCAGVLYIEADVRAVSEIAGVSRRLPVTMGTFAVAACSLAGIPLLAGFVSKWHLLVGGASVSPIVPVVLVVSGVLNVAYFWPIVYAAYFESADDADPKPVIEASIGGSEAEQPPVSDGGTRGEKSYRRVPADGSETRWTLLVPTLVTAALVVLLGVVPDQLFVLELVERVVEAAFGEVTR